MVSCLLEFNFLKEHLLHTYCYTFFLLCFLFFLPIEKICFQLFSAAFVLEIIFSKDITFWFTDFSKVCFFPYSKTFVLFPCNKSIPCVITTFKQATFPFRIFNQFLLV